MAPKVLQRIQKLTRVCGASLLVSFSWGCTGDIKPVGNAPASAGATDATTTAGGAAGGQSANLSTSGGGGTTTSGASTTGGSVDRTSVAFECDPEAPPSVTPLRRLTRLAYENSLRALFEQVPSVVDAAAASLAQLPPDGENDSVYSGNDSRVTQRHVDAYFGVADAIASAATADTSTLAAFAGACASETPLSEGCLSEFVSQFGTRVFRRPLSEAQIARYLELYDPALPAEEIFRGVVFQLLMAPQFLYQFETQGVPLAANAETLLLDPYELATRLAFHFWQSPPDAELLTAARTGSLMTDAGFEAEVDRLFEDPTTQETLLRFWHEWYQLDGFAGFASTPAFEAFSGDTVADDQLYQDMLDEVDQLLHYYTFDTDGSYRDVLTSDLVFTTSAPLASLYGVDAWDGAGAFPRFATGQRSGLLTRAALLVEGNELTNPIKRGAFVLRSILCEDLHPPSNLPAEALALPEVDPNMSTRQRYEQKTSPNECAGCHTLLNPYGFVLESFDALGRFRSDEIIYDAAGEVENQLPIDPVVEVQLGDERFPVATAAEFNARLADTGLMDECFARQYFRFAYRRNESTGDSCALAAAARRGRAWRQPQASTTRRGVGSELSTASCRVTLNGRGVV